MRRISDTELVRNYCLNNIGEVFDLNYLANKNFQDIPHVNLRKIVTRLIDSGLLRQISKGVYAIGESNLDDEERVIKHYLSDEKGLPVGDYLLYLEGYITECPTNKIIKSNLSKGNKNIGNVQVLESNSWFDKVSHGYHLNLAMELIDSGGPKDAEKIPCYLERLNKLLSNYNNDETFLIRVKDIYNASSYLELAKILDSMNISNNAIGIYGIKVHMHS